MLLSAWTRSLFESTPPQCRWFCVYVSKKETHVCGGRGTSEEGMRGESAHVTRAKIAGARDVCACLTPRPRLASLGVSRRLLSVVVFILVLDGPVALSSTFHLPFLFFFLNERNTRPHETAWNVSATSAQGGTVATTVTRQCLARSLCSRGRRNNERSSSYCPPTSFLPAPCTD